MTTSDSDSGFSMGDIPDDYGVSKDSSDVPSELPSIPGYEVESLLGEGGMGAVYRASWIARDSGPVAIKTLQHQRFQTLSASALRRFEREVDLLKSITHQNIVPILDSGEYSSGFQRVPYFTMPLMTGGDLSNLLDSNPIESREDLKEEVGKLTQMIGGLAEAHIKGIVHRDIKPRNIFTDESGSYILGDFGLAKEFEGDSDLTSTIGHMGTTPYAPPEQLLSAKTADRRADVYSIGVILYQFACYGLRPFSPDEDSDDAELSETSSIAKWQRSPDRAAPIPSHRARHLSDASYDYIVRKCLAYFPEHRYQSLEELARDLSAWRRGESVKGSLKERVRYGIIEPIRPHAKLLAAIAVIVGLLGSVATFQYVSKLSKDASKSKREMEASELKRRDDRLEELLAIVPRLPGETKFYETKRLADSRGEASRLWARADEICSELELDASEDFWSRHLNWTVNRCAPQGETQEESLKFRQRLRDVALGNHVYASQPDEVEESISDVCRSYRIIFEFYWLTKENEDPANAPWIEEYLAQEARFFEEVKRLRSDALTAAARRILKLAQLEVEIRHPLLSAQQRFDLCRVAEAELTPSQLKKDGCERLQTWYMPWYIYWAYAEASSELDRPVEETKRIFQLWMANQEETPHLSKLQNSIYLIDKRFILDLQTDVSRRISPAEARATYEALWRNGQRLLSFYRNTTRSWSDCEQSLSSLITLARELEDEELEFTYRERAIDFYRDWLEQIQANDAMFSKEVVMDVRYEFAFQIASVLTTGRDVNKQVILDAVKGLQVVLAEDPDFRRVKSLATYIESELKKREGQD